MADFHPCQTPVSSGITRRTMYRSDMPDAEQAAIRPLVLVPAWFRGSGGPRADCWHLSTASC